MGFFSFLKRGLCGFFKKDFLRFFTLLIEQKTQAFDVSNSDKVWPGR